jgi:Domain of unknown function (DUF4365)
VSSAAGLVCQAPIIDVNKVDVQVSTWGPWNGRARTIALQLKATSSPSFIGSPGNGTLAFPLDGPDYNAMLGDSTMPCFLVVVCLPKIEETWVRQRPSVVGLSAGAWWLKIAGDPTTQTQKTVHLPVEQRFDPVALQAMLELA